MRLYCGLLKDNLRPLPRTYSARFVESQWYNEWQSKGYFKPSSDGKGEERRRFAMIIPPPNITGSLHLGHAYTIALEDALVRWHRMRGYETVWIPGMDHAGIATQVQVEKLLWQTSKKTRHDVGRQEFLRLAESWRKEKSERILSQMKRLGATVDWERQFFTLDSHIQYGVSNVFVRLFDQKKVFRDKQFVNWCSQLNSTISDIEVEHKEVDAPTKLRVAGQKQPIEVGFLYEFAYALADGTGEVVVATTRPETILGDTAVAVHPSDQR